VELLHIMQIILRESLQRELPHIITAMMKELRNLLKK